jgi:hypothetical protein
MSRFMFHTLDPICFLQFLQNKLEVGRNWQISQNFLQIKWAACALLPASDLTNKTGLSRDLEVLNYCLRIPEPVFFGLPFQSPENS